MSDKLPVWTSNRGTVMMIRVALAQSGRTPLFADSLTEFEKMVRETAAGCVIAGIAEIQAAGMTPAAFKSRLGKDIHYVLLSSGQNVPDTPGLKSLRIPFSAAELREAVESLQAGGRSNPVRTQVPDGADLTSIVKAEVDRIVMEKAQAMVAEAVMKMVPELAEAIIKAELERLISDAGEKAVSTDPSPDDED